MPAEDRPFTASKGNGGLYQSTRIAYGLVNAVPWFQRIMDNLIETEDCKATFAYLNNITVYGKIKQEHD